jgi:hypothetical protein
MLATCLIQKRPTETIKERTVLKTAFNEPDERLAPIEKGMAAVKSRAEEDDDDDEAASGWRPSRLFGCFSGLTTAQIMVLRLLLLSRLRRGGAEFVVAFLNFTGDDGDDVIVNAAVTGKNNDVVNNRTTSTSALATEAALVSR